MAVGQFQPLAREQSAIEVFDMIGQNHVFFQLIEANQAHFFNPFLIDELMNYLFLSSSDQGFSTHQSSGFLYNFSRIRRDILFQGVIDKHAIPQEAVFRPISQYSLFMKYEKIVANSVAVFYIDKGRRNKWRSYNGKSSALRFTPS
jgi:hypothetical protein